MQEIVQFLKENITGFLATVDNGKPRVRPFQFMMEKDGRLYFCTNNTKDVFKQLSVNPSVEFCSLSPNFQWIRLAGNIQFTDDPALKSEVLQASEMVKSIYQTPDNPIFVIFYLEHGKATIADFSGRPPKQADF
ncbi:MAG: pyridoxamine 5'-phosphate oxidase family protein [Syntrophobacteraceae bacterium]|nr:pyridoxamine 5'-phosphate oxidase family protein [Syntrophobacteraceae bacterium]